ncbi:MAG: hypothetical protein JOZ47_05420 [Kutzneria sp.]|nr:hypothetical protein [Kutzneria sp.]
MRPIVDPDGPADKDDTHYAGRRSPATERAQPPPMSASSTTLAKLGLSDTALSPCTARTCSLCDGHGQVDPLGPADRGPPPCTSMSESSSTASGGAEQLVEESGRFRG